MMARNLDNRVELLAPVEDATAHDELAAILEACLGDSALAWALSPDGAWSRVEGPPDAPPRNSQDELMARAAARPSAPSAA